MTAEAAPLVDRLKKGLARVDAEPATSSVEPEALSSLRRSIARTLARLEGGAAVSTFSYKLSGATPLLFQGTEALPLTPDRLSRLLNAMDVDLKSGEPLDLDGELAGWIIRPEANITDTNLRKAEEAMRGMKTGRDRDHSAAQTAESQKVRLRSRLTQLVGALQAAQRDTAAKV